MLECFQLTLFHTTLTIFVRPFFSFTACSVRNPTSAVRGTLLRMLSNSVDLLRSTLGPKDLKVAQKLIVDQRLLSSREVNKFSTRKQDDNANPNRSHTM